MGRSAGPQPRDCRLMPYHLHIPGEPPQALRWTVHDPRSSYGNGVLVYRNSRDMLDGAAFRDLRDRLGAWIETDRPERVRTALSLMQDEAGIVQA